MKYSTYLQQNLAQRNKYQGNNINILYIIYEYQGKLF